MSYECPDETIEYLEAEIKKHQNEITKLKDQIERIKNDDGLEA
jgi:prefoldin subunit 5